MALTKIKIYLSRWILFDVFESKLKISFRIKEYQPRNQDSFFISINI